MPLQKIVLLVEDSPDDVILFQRAFSRANLTHTLVAVGSGADTLLYLNGRGKYSDRAQHPLPSAIFLDLRLPDEDGLAVLEKIRSQFTRQQLLIIVLSGAQELRRMRNAYQLGADSFIQKPPSPEDFRNIAANFPNHF